MTSPLDRDYETAIAMGYAVNETAQELGPYPEDVKGEFTKEAHTFPRIQRLLNQKTFTYHYADQIAEFILDQSSKIQDGRKLLLISHGGVVDIPLVYLLPNEDLSSWGTILGYYEGFRITLEDKKVVDYELVRTM